MTWITLKTQLMIIQVQIPVKQLTDGLTTLDGCNYKIYHRKKQDDFIHLAFFLAFYTACATSSNFFAASAFLLASSLLVIYMLRFGIPKPRTNPEKAYPAS